MENRLKINKEWIRIPSRTRPGRHYLFNVETGESKWCSSIENVSNRITHNTEMGALNPTSRTIRTPAQNRLKRLQQNLRSEHYGRRSVPKPLQKSARNEMHLNTIDMPSASSSVSYCKPQPVGWCTGMNSKGREKRKMPSNGNELELSKKLKCTDDNNKRLATALATVGTTTSTAIPTDYSESNCNSALSTIRTGLVKRIKDICKRPFTNATQRTKKKDEQKQHEENEENNNANTVSDAEVDDVDNDDVDSSEGSSEIIEHKDVHMRNAMERALRGLNGRREKNSHNNELNNNYDDDTSFATATTATLIPIAFNRNAANMRLRRLRQAITEEPSTSKTAAVTPTNTKAVAVKTNDLQKSNTLESASELMDWQPIIKSEPIEISDSETDIYTPTNGAKALPSPIHSSRTLNILSDSTTIMADLYDTVNENLLRFSMAQSKELNNNDNNEMKWFKDHYYFVLDTNVLLEHLSFIDDLSKMKLLVTKGIVLYLPYCVLQELDKLKQGLGKHENVKTLAVRAIKYLNEKFEMKSSNLAGQSAMEEKKHLIKVHSADDNIINCCLQVKRNVPNVILLTEDINLRNKAICNNISVATKSDLLAKHYDSVDNASNKSINGHNGINSTNNTNNNNHNNSCSNNNSNSYNNKNSSDPSDSNKQIRNGIL